METSHSGSGAFLSTLMWPSALKRMEACDFSASDSEYRDPHLASGNVLENPIVNLLRGLVDQRMGRAVMWCENDASQPC